MSKCCTRCGESKVLESFPKDKRSPLGRSAQCKPCVQRYRTDRGYSARWRAKQLVQDPDMDRRYSLGKYGVALADRAVLLQKRKGSCDACAGPANGKGKTLHIDHDHVTGRIRGLLCHKCNTALGLASDSVARMEAFILYLSDADRGE